MGEGRSERDLFLSRARVFQPIELRAWGAGRGDMLRRAANVAFTVPVFITINDCIVSVARADASEPRENIGAGPRETGEASSSSPSPGTSARLVLLDRVTPRTFSFARGDAVYLRSPSNQDRWVTRRLVALEGDWVTRAADDDVTKVPRGHCWIESVEAGTGVEADEDGRAVPLALLDARVSHVLWPPSEVGAVRRETRPGRVLMRTTEVDPSAP